MVIAGVALAGGVGALIRWMVSTGMAHRTGMGGPTTLVNLVGAFALGVMAGLSDLGRIGPDVAVVVGTGLLGALTTFSTWMVEALEEHRRSTAPVWRRTVIPTLAGVVLAWSGMQAAHLLG